MPITPATHDRFIPDGLSGDQAFTRTTHLGIGAHQDDLEFMALHGILECFQRRDQWFGGITCTDGAGSSRSGPYADYSDEEMKKVRSEEQRTAARIGQYSFMVQLGHPSSVAKDPSKRKTLVDDLFQILASSQPEWVYTHNPFDKHATHIGVCLATIAAIKRLPAHSRPRQLFGCEVWRGLDWLPDELKILHDVSPHQNLAAALNGVFDSQIVGGKRYDRAVEGRRLANATFLDSHSVDDAERVAYAIDLTPLTKEDGPDLEAFAAPILEKFTESVNAGFR